MMFKIVNLLSTAFFFTCLKSIQSHFFTKIDFRELNCQETLSYVQHNHTKYQIDLEKCPDEWNRIGHFENTEACFQVASANTTTLDDIDNVVFDLSVLSFFVKKTNDHNRYKKGNTLRHEFDDDGKCMQDLFYTMKQLTDRLAIQPIEPYNSKFVLTLLQTYLYYEEGRFHENRFRRSKANVAFEKSKAIAQLPVQPDLISMLEESIRKCIANTSISWRLPTSPGVSHWNREFKDYDQWNHIDVHVVQDGNEKLPFHISIDFYTPFGKTLGSFIPESGPLKSLVDHWQLELASLEKNKQLYHNAFQALNTPAARKILKEEVMKELLNSNLYYHKKSLSVVLDKTIEKIVLQQFLITLLGLVGLLFVYTKSCKPCYRTQGLLCNYFQNFCAGNVSIKNSINQPK